MKAIVYTSNTGSAAQYAALLAKETALPVYALAEAVKKLPRGTEILYVGWLRAGTVKGYKKAAKRFAVQAVCAVGMFETGTQTEYVRKTNKLLPELPLFTLQGNLDRSKLHGLYRLMIDIMRKGVTKGLSEKKDRTPEEDSILSMMTNGTGRVKAENLKDVLAWLAGRQ